MIELKLTFASFEELADFADRMAAEEQEAPSSPKASPKATLKAPAKKAAKPAPEPEEEIEEELEEETVEEGEEEEVPEDPTFDDVRDAIMKVNKLKGKSAATAILKKFGVEKVGPSLKEAVWGKFVAACNAALEE